MVAAALPATRTTSAPWERIGASLCLAQCAEPFFAALAQSQGLDEVPGYARLAWTPVYLFLAIVAWRDWRAFGGAMAKTPLLIALLGLALLSMFWSLDPDATLRRVVWLALTMAFGLYLAWRYRWAELLDVFGWTWIVLIAGSAALSIFAPHMGVMAEEHPGAWSGLWTHKNTLGGVMALGVAIGASAFLVTKRWLWAGVATASFVMVLMSTSKTALLASCVGLGVIALSAFARRGPMQTIVVLTGIGVVAILGTCIALLAPEVLVALIGRDLTFTGRTEIWAAVERAVEARPWLGHGYYAFWLIESGPVYAVRSAVNWPVPSAHNGWLELVLGLGLVGLALFALQFAATLKHALGALKDPVAGLWAPAFIAAFTLYTMSESHILEANNLFWTLYVAMAARLALDAKEQRR